MEQSEKRDQVLERQVGDAADPKGRGIPTGTERAGDPAV